MKIAGRLVLWCSLVVACAFLAGSAEAQQQQIYEFEYIERYYADATMTEPIVGAKWRDCCGNWLIYGNRTQYWDSSNYPCDECFPYEPLWPAASELPEPTEQMRKMAVRRAFSTAHGTPARCTRSKTAI